MITERPSSFAKLVDFPLASWKVARASASDSLGVSETHGTTALAVRYADGVLLLADRRATAGNLIMFDHAEKIIPLDDSTVIAISGSFARSVEMARFLKHSLKYYRRVTLGELSLSGKLQEITKALASNMQMALSGIGVFLPIVASYDRSTNEFGVYFFDGAGARFENREYACAGSGSERIRGLFDYLGRTKGAWHTRKLDDVLLDTLQMLDIAAELDSATGGLTKILPTARILTRSASEPISDSVLQKAAQKVLAVAKKENEPHEEIRRKKPSPQA
jgi:proteasome beta subunit